MRRPPSGDRMGNAESLLHFIMFLAVITFLTTFTKINRNLTSNAYLTTITGLTRWTGCNRDLTGNAMLAGHT